MNSIRATLVVMLLAAFTLVSFLAALNGYLSSMSEAESLLDKQLQYSSDILVATAGGEAPDMTALPRSGEFAFQVWRNGILLLRSPGATPEPIGALEPGFSYANFGGYRWRTLARQAQQDTWYIVAERADLRNAVAEKVVLESVLPLMLWLPVSALLVWLVVGLGLRPLRDLSQQINLRRSDDLQPIRQDSPPAELVQLIDSTNALLARLAAAFEREKHFASHAAHELRTPLSALKVHLHNLAQELPRENPALVHANAGVERMHHLVEQILDLNRTNPEIIKANFHSLDLHALAQRVTASAWPGFAARDQALSLSGEAVWMAGDEVMLETLLDNLLVNAGKYTPAGGEVQVFAGGCGDVVRLQVEDSGPGIPAAERKLVFKRFYRAAADGNSALPGSGLGLAIVQHIVQLHNATIRLGESSLGNGLAVTIDFPLQGAAG
jgi:two-component system sensor histidine kinase QseC